MVLRLEGMLVRILILTYSFWRILIKYLLQEKKNFLVSSATYFFLMGLW